MKNEKPAPALWQLCKGRMASWRTLAHSASAEIDRALEAKSAAGKRVMIDGQVFSVKKWVKWEQVHAFAC